MKLQNIHILNICQSLNAINFWQWEVSVLATRGKHQGVAAHEGQRQSAELCRTYVNHPSQLLLGANYMAIIKVPSV